MTSPRSRLALLLCALVLLVSLSLLSLAVGRVWISPTVLFANSDETRAAILLGLRLPRTLLALLIGAALGAGGAALQGYTRNPLADPGVLGVSAMAAFGAVLSLYFGSSGGAWSLPLMAVGGAMLGITSLLLLAGLAGGIVTFLLAGVILQTVAGAGVALALSLAPNPWAIGEIVDWLMGSLQDRSIVELRFATPLIVVGTILVFTTGRALDALTLGERTARTLGVGLDAARLRLVFGVGLATGGAVAAAGAIGFVGLIVPHLLRPLVGAQPGRLLLPSAIGGALLLLAADIAVRLVPSASELKLGIALTALGAPFFLVLLLRQRRHLA